MSSTAYCWGCGIGNVLIHRCSKGYWKGGGGGSQTTSVNLFNNFDCFPTCHKI